MGPYFYWVLCVQSVIALDNFTVFSDVDFSLTREEMEENREMTGSTARKRMSQGHYYDSVHQVDDLTQKESKL